jgi:hypothetical protein|tara:strand:+ start:726 stop:953 length:228 start_codon:yes stop_codon:yes gene_type:complete
MKKIILILLIIFTFSSCGFDVKPNVSVKNDINLTIDGENIDGLQGEWIISIEEKEDDKKDKKEIIIITIEKNELD